MIKRRFDSSQRVEAFVQADGKCEQCGKQLEPGWHAHHRVPYAKGGPTELWNEQALCPNCNLRLGDKYPMRIKPWSYSLREWQDEVYTKWLNHKKPNFLLVGTPGCGKTIAMLRIVHHALENGMINRVIIIVPSVHLCEQWANVANGVGIDLDPNFENKDGAIAPDMHGIIVTYQQVCNVPHLFKTLAKQTSTGVIFDEVHHCATEKAWGDGIKVFEDSTIFQLAGSGTPWRSDANPIPYILYETNNDGSLKSVPNYRYSYHRALYGDKNVPVCRHVVFPAFEGIMEWMKGENYYEATFADKLSEDEARDRLKTAVSFCLKNSWAKDVSVKAYKHLLELRRNGHPDAGLLVTVMNKEEAEAAETFFRSDKSGIGISPVVVHYDDKAAHTKIDRFSKSVDPVLIAIKMVSEGIDIPRLRIGIYATNILTELYIWQFIGRFLRWINELENQTAYVYFPKDVYFVKVLKEIQQERDHLIEELVKRERQCPECGHLHHWHICTEYDDKKEDFCHCEYRPEPRGDNAFLPIRSEKTDGVMIFQSGEYDGRELGEAERLMRKMGISPSQINVEIVAALVNEIQKEHPSQQISAHEQQSTKLADKKVQLSTIANSLASKIVYTIGEDRIEHKTLHGLFNKLIGVKSSRVATEEQLRLKVEVLNRVLKNVERAGAAFDTGDIRQMMSTILEQINASR